ncbi:MAG: biotin synthase BioB [Pseudomonadota bacterium]
MDLDGLRDKIRNNNRLGFEDGLAILRTAATGGIDQICRVAEEIQSSFYRTIEFCAIVNAKSGSCPNDCSFCAQSIHNRSSVPEYPLRTPEDLLAAAVKAERAGAHRFSLVTSGAKLSGEELSSACETVRMIRERTNLLPCASLGSISAREALELRKAGLVRYHHNLETSRRFYPRICTTQGYDDRVATVSVARDAGLEVCVGGILGLGEEEEDWLYFIGDLDRLRPDAIPLNFLDPRPGTRLEGRPVLSPEKALEAVALFRIMLPKAIIRLAGGRRKTLKHLQSRAVRTGVDAVMIGNYLTTKGPDIEADRRMIEGLNLSPGMIRTNRNA